MTESKIYADNFKCSFRNSDQFLDFLKERKEKSLWMKAPSNSLQFKPLEKDSELGNLYMQLYQSNGSAEILVDTMENTSLLLSVNGADYPVRSCALKTILERARISGNALGKVSKSVLTQILNYCLDVATGDSLIKVADDKVSAVHGGDPSDYAVLEMTRWRIWNSAKATESAVSAGALCFPVMSRNTPISVSNAMKTFTPSSRVRYPTV